MKLDTILDDIGNTPHLRIHRLFGDAEVWIKLERDNPGGSIKDRIGLSMIEDAERRGVLKTDSVIIEPTSGNTGIGLAMVAAVKGYRLILVMPESMSIERRRLMATYGAEFELTPREGGMPGAIKRAKQMLHEIAERVDAECSSRTRRTSTSTGGRPPQEILRDFPEGLDYLITGVGTGGHITACAEVLKAKFPNLKVFAVEPAASPVISGGKPGPHPLQGIGAGFIPAILETELLDGTIQVEKDESFAFAARAAREEGLLVGVSSGAALAAVAKKLPELPKGSRVLTFCYDTGERYLSVDGLFA